MEYPILHNPGSIEQLMNKVRETDPPGTVDHDYLISLGFKREVDEGLLKLLRFLGFIDESGKPTFLWQKSHSGRDAPALLGKAVQAAYRTLFKTHPMAATEEGSVLMDFFRKNSSASDPDAAYMILTFKVLCDLSEFTGEPPIDDEEEKEPAPQPKKAKAPEPSETEVKGKKGKKEEETIGEVAARGTSPVLRLSINIDIDDSDPELRALAMKLLRKQLGD